MDDDYEFVHTSSTTQEVKELAVTATAHITAGYTSSIVNILRDAFCQFIATVITSYFEVYNRDKTSPEPEWWDVLDRHTTFTTLTYNIRIVVESAVGDMEADQHGIKGGGSWTAGDLIRDIEHQLTRKLMAWKKARANAVRQARAIQLSLPPPIMTKVHDFLTTRPSVFS